MKVKFSQNQLMLLFKDQASSATPACLTSSSCERWAGRVSEGLWWAWKSCAASLKGSSPSCLLNPYSKTKAKSPHLRPSLRSPAFGSPGTHTLVNPTASMNRTCFPLCGRRLHPQLSQTKGTPLHCSGSFLSLLLSECT